MFLIRCTALLDILYTGALRVPFIIIIIIIIIIITLNQCIFTKYGTRSLEVLHMSLTSPL